MAFRCDDQIVDNPPRQWHSVAVSPRLVTGAILIGVILSTRVLSADEKLSSEQDFFETRVRPLLAKNCFLCHSEARAGGLQMDSKDAMMRGSKDGVVVVPGKPDASTLWESVETGRMPPDKTKPLSAAEKELIWRWIESGAK